MMEETAAATTCKPALFGASGVQLVYMHTRTHTRTHTNKHACPCADTHARTSKPVCSARQGTDAHTQIAHIITRS
jgi:hypothetical protein